MNIAAQMNMIQYFIHFWVLRPLDYTNLSKSSGMSSHYRLELY